MNRADSFVQCRLACGAEAVAMGYPEQAGYDICDGCATDSFIDWGVDRFVDWLMELQILYGMVSPTGCRFLCLYRKCSEIIVSVLEC